MNRLHWVLSYNYFHSIFEISFASVYESGIYKGWREYFLANAEKKEKRTLQAKLPGSNIVDMHVQETKSVYVNILVHFSVFVGVGVVGFTAEYAYHCAISTKVKKWTKWKGKFIK